MSYQRAGGLRRWQAAWWTARPFAPTSGCARCGENATVEITLFNRDGAELGSTRRTLRGFENIQINRVVRAVLGQQQLVDGIVEVRLLSGGGRVGAYISIVDNQTDDPTYRLLSP